VFLLALQASIAPSPPSSSSSISMPSLHSCLAERKQVVGLLLAALSNARALASIARDMLLLRANLAVLAQPWRRIAPEQVSRRSGRAAAHSHPHCTGAGQARHSEPAWHWQAQSLENTGWDKCFCRMASTLAAGNLGRLRQRNCSAACATPFERRETP
jgi:hypothetical protein